MKLISLQPYPTTLQPIKKHIEKKNIEMTKTMYDI